MQNVLHRKGLGLLAAVSLAANLAIAPSVHAASIYPSLQLESAPEQVLPHACNPSQLKQLKGEVLELAAGHAPMLAWSLVHAMLCRKGPIARQLVLTHMPKVLSSSDTGSGQEAVKELVPRSAEFMMNGNAWGATVSRELDTLSVSAFANGACGAGFDLKFLNGTWLIVAVGYGCD